MSIFSKIGSFFHPTMKQQQTTNRSIGNKIAPGVFNKKYQGLEDLQSFKKGGPVKKTGAYKLHKGEFVLNPRLVALIKSGEGPKKKGYEQTYKTVPKKKYDRDNSINYRKKSGYFKTKIDGGGHDAGFKWATKQFREGNLEPTTRKKKWGRNSPSFDEGFYEAKMRALNKKLK